MSAVKPTKIQQALLKKGFLKDETHHHYYWLFYKGKKTHIKTFISHGLKEYGDDLLNKVAKQMGLNKQLLLDFVQCRMEEKDYIQHLVETSRLVP